MIYSYQYLTDDGKRPLKCCPNCQHDLTKPKSVTVLLSVDYHEVETKSRLNKAGFLEDTHDEAIAHGFHHGTLCGNCCTRLTDNDSVKENCFTSQEEQNRMVKKYRKLLRALEAFADGVRDGFEEPEELSSGLTFKQQYLNEVYDLGVNLGQALGAEVQGVKPQFDTQPGRPKQPKKQPRKKPKS